MSQDGGTKGEGKHGNMDCNLTYSELCRLAFLHISEAQLSETELDRIKQVLQIGETSGFDGSYQDLTSNTLPTDIPEFIPDVPAMSAGQNKGYALNHTRGSGSMPRWSSVNRFTSDHLIKLQGIEPGAQVSVQADWNAASGDSWIRNKPTGNNSVEQANWTQNDPEHPGYIHHKPLVSQWGEIGFRNPPPNPTDSQKQMIQSGLDLTDENLYNAAFSNTPVLTSQQSEILQSTLGFNSDRVLLPLIDEGFAVPEPPTGASSGTYYPSFDVYDEKFYFLRATPEAQANRDIYIDVYDTAGTLLAGDRLVRGIRLSEFSDLNRGSGGFRKRGLRIFSDNLQVLYEKSQDSMIEQWNVTYDSNISRFSWGSRRAAPFRYYQLNNPTHRPGSEPLGESRNIYPYDSQIYSVLPSGNKGDFSRLDGVGRFFDNFFAPHGFIPPIYGNARSFDRIGKTGWCFASKNSFIVCRFSRNFVGYAEFPPIISNSTDHTDANIQSIRTDPHNPYRIYLLVRRDNATQILTYYYGPVGFLTS